MRLSSLALLSVFATGFFCLSAGPSQAGDHEATLHISAMRGEVGAHFARYSGHKIIDPKMAGLEPGSDQGTRLLNRLGIAADDFSKVASRDASRRISSSDPWTQTVSLAGGGTFILNLSDWTGQPHVKVELKMDGITLWEAEGSADSFKQWVIKTQSPQVKTTDDQKLLVMLE